MEQIRDQQRLQRVLQDAGNKLVVLICMDKNCPHCKRAMPGMEELALRLNNVCFVRADVRENPNFVNDYNLTAVPSYCFFKNGSMVDHITGADKQTIEERIKQLSG